MPIHVSQSWTVRRFELRQPPTKKIQECLAEGMATDTADQIPGVPFESSDSRLGDGTRGPNGMTVDQVEGLGCAEAMDVNPNSLKAKANLEDVGLLKNNLASPQQTLAGRWALTDTPPEGEEGEEDEAKGTYGIMGELFSHSVGPPEEEQSGGKNRAMQDGWMPFSAAPGGVEQRCSGAKQVTIKDGVVQEVSSFEAGQSRNGNGSINGSAARNAPRISTRYATSEGSAIFESNRPWWRDRNRLDGLLFRARCCVCFLAISGFFVSMVTHEMPVRGFDPSSSLVDRIKCVETILTVCLILSLYFSYYIYTAWHFLGQHLKGMPWAKEQTYIFCPLWNYMFWLEVLVCMWHSPPGYTREWGYYNEDFFHGYRSETLLSLASSLRTYTIWRVIRDLIIRDLPNRHAIGTMVQIQLGSQFSIKRMLQGTTAFFSLSFFTMFVVLLASYWVRCAECSSCRFKYSNLPLCKSDAGMYYLNDGTYQKDNLSSIQTNNYMWMDYVWGMIVTFSTVGYGDFVARTYIGRTVSLCVALCGIIAASTLTSSLAKALSWTPQEHTTLLLLLRDKAEVSLRRMAATRIQHWYRLHWARPSKRRTWRNWLCCLETDDAERSTFEGVRKLLMRHAEDSYGLEGHVDLMLKRSEHILGSIEDALSKMLERRRTGRVLRWAHSGKAKSQPKIAPISIGSSTQSESSDDDEHDSVSGTKNTSLQSFEDIRSVSVHESDKNLRNGASRDIAKGESFENVAMVESCLQSPSDKKKRRNHEKMVEKMRKIELRKANSIKMIGANGMEKIKRTESRAHLPRQRDLAQTSLIQARFVCCLLSACSIFLSIGINVLSWNSPPATMCASGFKLMDGLKLLDMLCSLSAGALIYLSYTIIARTDILTHHVTANAPLVVGCRADFLAVVAKWSFWVELLISLVHLPPCCSFWFGYGNSDGKKYSSINAENIFNIAVVAKMYQLWPVLREICYMDLPKRHFIARMTKVKLGSTFALKRLLNSQYAVVIVAIAWIYIVVVLSLLYRNFELTACEYPGWKGVDPICDTENAKTWADETFKKPFRKINDYRIFSAVWVVFVTSFTVGYGDMIPTMSAGRMILIISALLGICAAGLLTATIIDQLSWTPTEQSVMLMLERQKARDQLKDMASKMIGTFWLNKVRQRSRKHKKRGNAYKFAVRNDFKKVLLMSRIDTEKLGGVERKVGTISKRLRETRDITDQLVGVVGVASTTRRRSLEYGLNSIPR